VPRRAGGFYLPDVSFTAASKAGQLWPCPCFFLLWFLRVTALRSVEFPSESVMPKRPTNGEPSLPLHIRFRDSFPFSFFPLCFMLLGGSGESSALWSVFLRLPTRFDSLVSTGPKNGSLLFLSRRFLLSMVLSVIVLGPFPRWVRSVFSLRFAC